MARIDSPRLAIAVDSSAKTARCEVTCKVYFTAYEMREMREGLNFRLDCSLWEEDVITHDDYLYSYGSKFFPDASPTSPESATFSAVLGLSLLNQEWGRDEIYARLALKNLYTRVTVTANTNVVKRNF